MTNATLQKEIAAMKADIRDLQKKAQASAAVERVREHLRAEIIKGLNSGPGKPMNAAYWKGLRALARQKARKA